MLIDPYETRLRERVESALEQVSLDDLSDEELARAFRKAWDNRDDETEGPLRSALAQVIEQDFRWHDDIAAEVAGENAA